MQLEKQEYLAEAALKEELLRQEKLEQLAHKFERKSVLREGYLNEMIAVLSSKIWVNPATGRDQCREARGHLCRHPCKAREVQGLKSHE